MSNQDSMSEGFLVDGIIWHYDYQDRVWRYEEWVISYERQSGYVLVFPGGHREVLRSTSVFGAMLDAPWYIRRYHPEW